MDKNPVEIIEAKKEDEGHKLTVAEDQAKEYSLAKLKYLNNDPLPFVFESTGTIIRFRDTRDPKPRGRNIFWFYRPETLAEWLQKDKSLRTRLLDIPILNEAIPIQDRTPEKEEQARKQAQKELINQAASSFNGKLNDYIEKVRIEHEQIIDSHNLFREPITKKKKWV